MTVLGIVRAHPDPLIDGLIGSIEGAAGSLNLTIRRVVIPDEERSVDTLLIVGYPRAYATFLEAPRSARRIAWFGEPLPRPSTGRRALGGRSRPLPAPVLRGTRRVARRLSRGIPGPVFARIREAAAIDHERATNLLDARWCAALVDSVVVTSRDRLATLAQHSIAASAVPFGYDPAGSGPLVDPASTGRDISIAVLGAGTSDPRRRRGRILTSIAPDLHRLGDVRYLEGVWGPERDAALRRSRIVLDIQRVPGNFTGLRLLAALAAGTALVTEPMDDPYPFVPGTDHVAADGDEIVAVVADLLSDEERRVGIAAAGQRRLMDELSMTTSLSRVLAA